MQRLVIWQVAPEGRVVVMDRHIAAQSFVVGIGNVGATLKVWQQVLESVALVVNFICPFLV